MTGDRPSGCSRGLSRRLNWVVQIPAIEYLVWAKRHRRVRYELTASGVPPAELPDIDARLSHVDLGIQGSYGHPRLIEAIACRYQVDPAGVVPVPGASSGIFIALATTVRLGEAVLVEHPGYQSFRRVADFLGLRVEPMYRRPETSFQLDLDELPKALGAGTRAVVMSNLHNPSAQETDSRTLASIASLCATHGAALIVDEVYLDYGYVNLGRPLWTAASSGDNVIAIGSLTEVYGLGGLRAGWLLMSPRRAYWARRMMDYLSVDMAALSSALAIRAFAVVERLEARTRRLYEAGQPVFREWLAGQSRLRGYQNQGAVFEWLRLPDGISAGHLNNVLVRRYDTRVVPGEFFGAPDHLRVSCSGPANVLRAGLRNIADALERLLQSRSA